MLLNYQIVTGFQTFRQTTIRVRAAINCKICNELMSNNKFLINFYSQERPQRQVQILVTFLMRNEIQILIVTHFTLLRSPKILIE